jgi:regulator of ribonuclease activity A
MAGGARIVLPDLCDANEEIVRVAEPVFWSFGGRAAYGGVIETVKCFEDNSLVAERVGEPGEGRVLVVDGGGSRRCALVGDNLAGTAAANGWQGIVVYGCVRDVDALARIDIGVHALAAHPLRSVKKGVGERDRAVTFAGVSFVPGQYVYADRNGVIVAPIALVE